MRAELTLETVEQLGALAHPLRQRVLAALLEAPRTNQQLASALQESPARLHFHVRELARAGLIEQVEARPKRGVIEKYYRAVAGSFRLGPSLGAAAPHGAGPALGALDAAREELARAVEQARLPVTGVRVIHERVRLSGQALARIHQHLEAISEVFRAASEQPPGQERNHPTVFTALLHPTGFEQ